MPIMATSYNRYRKYETMAQMGLIGTVSQSIMEMQLIKPGSVTFCDPNMKYVLCDHLEDIFDVYISSKLIYLMEKFFFFSSPVCRYFRNHLTITVLYGLYFLLISFFYLLVGLG